MDTFKMINAAGVAILLAACSATSKGPAPNTAASEKSEEEKSGEVMGASAAQTGAATAAPVATSDSPLESPDVPTPSKAQASQFVLIPDDVLRDNGQVAMLKQHMRAQIVNKSRKIPQVEYEQLVRPSVAGQLRAAGFDDPDVDNILSSVDYSRRIAGIR